MESRLHPKLHPLTPQPRWRQRSQAQHQAGTQTPQSQPPDPDPYVLEQHPRLCNRWLRTAVPETLWETWMSTRRKRETPRDFLSKGVVTAWSSKNQRAGKLFCSPTETPWRVVSLNKVTNGEQTLQSMFKRKCKQQQQVNLKPPLLLHSKHEFNSKLAYSPVQGDKPWKMCLKHHPKEYLHWLP